MMEWNVTEQTGHEMWQQDILWLTQTTPNSLVVPQHTADISSEYSYTRQPYLNKDILDIWFLQSIPSYEQFLEVDSPSLHADKNLTVSNTRYFILKN